MNDLIDRQAAIDAVEFGITFAKVIDKSTGEVKELFREGNDSLTAAIKRIKNLPSAQPDSLVRSSARWMSVGHKRARICSHCFRDEPYKFADHDADIYDFCPHCGAKMEVDDGPD